MKVHKWSDILARRYTPDQIQKSKERARKELINIVLSDVNSAIEEYPSVDYFLNRNYPVNIYEDHKNGGLVAEIPDLPGCVTQAETKEELVKMIEDAKRLWIETAYKHGDHIPTPR